MPLPGIVLADDVDPVPLAAFGLGMGGLDTRRPGPLRVAAGRCTTPGGIVVQCLGVGVKLTFPSGRELLLAPDGVLHLRDGAVGGPFRTGVELRLGDATRLRIKLSQAQRRQVREVVVVHGERQLRLWRRGRPVRESVRSNFWGGPRVCCCGDGGELYRAIAIGPLIALDRVLVPVTREQDAPTERLVVLTEPLTRALGELPRVHRSRDPDLQPAVAAVAATSRRATTIFPAGAGLRRADHKNLRWLLRGGYELELALHGPRAPRLALFAGRAMRPMVEWTLGMGGAAFLTNPRREPGASRWRGNGVTLAPIAPELQERRTLRERQLALAIIRRVRQR